MANSITLAKKYVDLLDEVYKYESKTAILDSDASLARAGANTNEIVIPKLSMDGLGNYSRSSGFVSGDATLNWETVKFNFDRGRMFTIDAMDDEETMGLAFGRLAGEFERTKVVPELDAFRFATYAQVEGISTVEGAALTTGANVISALRAAVSKMDEDEVPMEGRILFITSTLDGLIQDQDTSKSREVMSRFAKKVIVPQSRFYTKITQYDGTTGGQTAGGYVKDTTSSAKGVNINFMVIHPSALMQYTKHAVPKIITPEQNQNADAYKYGYRSYGLADVYENKVAGIYLHKATA